MDTRKCEPQLDDDSIINFMVFILRTSICQFFIHDPCLDSKEFQWDSLFFIDLQIFSSRNSRSKISISILLWNKLCFRENSSYLNAPEWTKFYQIQKIPERKNRNFHDKYAHFERQIIPPIENQLQNGQNKILCFPNQNCKFNFML